MVASVLGGWVGEVGRYRTVCVCAGFASCCGHGLGLWWAFVSVVIRILGRAKVGQILSAVGEAGVVVMVMVLLKTTEIIAIIRR